MTTQSMPLTHSINPASLRILAVDDEPDNLLLIRQALRRSGYTSCETETNPVNAVARFHSESFDLVLLDYNMPVMSGLDVLVAIADKAREQHISVVMVTAQGDRDTRLLTLRAGAKDFLSKPLDLAELSIRVKNLLETRSLHLALTQNNLQLEQVVNERTHELNLTRLEIIRRLSRAAEFRDNETGIHVQRMSLYSEAIGRQMNLSAHNLDLLLHACPMHDLGKIGISDLILLKPGKLTPEEFTTMQKHTTIGAQIMEDHDSELLRTAHDIALYHHEKWDGTGYPHGLAGESIPLMARIASVADVFDALTMVRPYKKAWDIDKAYQEIIKMTGANFDPVVSEAFQACFSKILEIRAAYPDSDPE